MCVVKVANLPLEESSTIQQHPHQAEETWFCPLHNCMMCGALQENNLSLSALRPPLSLLSMLKTGTHITCYRHATCMYAGYTLHLLHVYTRSNNLCCIHNIFTLIPLSSMYTYPHILIRSYIHSYTCIYIRRHGYIQEAPQSLLHVSHCAMCRVRE